MEFESFPGNNFFLMDLIVPQRKTGLLPDYRIIGPFCFLSGDKLFLSIKDKTRGGWPWKMI